MKLSNILPASLIGRGYDGDFIMALSNYIDKETQNGYELAVLKANLPIVLDNGAFETGTAEGVDNLLIKVKKLNPAYVFAPDTLFDASQTKAGFEAFEHIKKNLKIKVRTAVVVQANNLDDYLKEFQRYNEDPRVSVIGLSYLAISYSMKYPNFRDVPMTKKATKKYPFNVFRDPDYTKDRIEMLKKINNLNLKKIKPVHLLGLGKSYEDIIFADKNCPYCLYNDTSTCYMASLKKLELTNNLEVPGGKIREKINIENPSDKEVEELLNINIKKVKKCLK